MSTLKYIRLSALKTIGTLLLTIWIAIPATCNNDHEVLLNDTTLSTVKKIVTLAPNLTEIVFALGLGETVIAVSDFDIYPEGVTELPRVGGYFNPNLERLISLKPDVIFALEGRSTKTEKLKKIQADIYYFKTENLEDILNSIEEMGKILGVDDTARDLCVQINNQMKALALPESKNLSVMVCVGMTPGSLQNLYVAGGQSIHNDLLNAIGCRNTFGHIENSYFPVNKETLIISKPDIIFDLIPGQPVNQRVIKERLETWALIPGIPAAENKRIIILNQDVVNIPGPRVGSAGTLLRENIEVLITGNPTP